MTSTRILCDEQNSAMSFDSCASFGCNSLVCASDVLAKLTPKFILVILRHSTLGNFHTFQIICENVKIFQTCFSFHEKQKICKGK
jgi:hypothetical protein